MLPSEETIFSSTFRYSVKQEIRKNGHRWKKNAAKIATMSTSTLKSEKPPQITLRLKHISKLQKLTSQCSKTTDSFIGTATALAEAIYCITCVIYGRLLLFFWSFFWNLVMLLHCNCDRSYSFSYMLWSCQHLNLKTLITK